MSDTRDYLTLMIIGAETVPVRRVRLRRSRLRQAAVAAGLCVLAALAVLADDLRLRFERAEIEELRAEALRQEDELLALQERVAALDAGLSEIRELERKVRIIADLPAASSEPAGPRARELDATPPAASAAPVASGAPAASAAPVASGAPAALAAPVASGGMGGEDGTTTEELERLSLWMAPTRSSFEDLLVGLEDKRQRLASMPSIWPTKGWVTSHYGMRRSPFTGRRQLHRGMDIAAHYGTAIRAPARGRISFVGRKGPLGHTVVIDHGFETRTTYGHTQEAFVAPGDLVERGTRIALVGNSGRSTGPHLHYAVSVKGESVDPRDYILE